MARPWRRTKKALVTARFRVDRTMRWLLATKKEREEKGLKPAPEHVEFFEDRWSATL